MLSTDYGVILHLKGRWPGMLHRSFHLLVCNHGDVSRGLRYGCSTYTSALDWNTTFQNWDGGAIFSETEWVCWKVESDNTTRDQLDAFPPTSRYMSDSLFFRNIYHMFSYYLQKRNYCH
jgi:hypothetical protein